MRAKQLFSGISIICLLALVPLSAFGDDLLTGDTRLACEAILCLSSGQRPHECDPSLNKYYSIKRRKFSDTLKARKNFLNLCPAAKEDDNMTSLVAVIVDAAGQCSAEKLNQTGTWIEQSVYVPLDQCRRPTVESPYYSEQYTLVTGESEDSCYQTIRYWQVSTTPPKSCQTLWEHSYTDYEQRPHLKTGSVPWETYWVE